MGQFLSSVVVPCMVFLCFSLEAGDFRRRIQSFCDQIEKVGQSWVDTIVYCDCSEQCPAVSISSIKEDCPSVFAADWRTNVDDKKIPEAQAMLALAQLSSACCNFLGHANVTHGKNPLPENGHGQESLCSPLLLSATSIKQIQPKEPEKIYRIEDLNFEKRGRYGNKNNSVFTTKDGWRLFIKNRHLKINYDSFLVSFFMSSLGEKLCPGQIVKIVPVIDNGELKIGSFEIENYIGQINQESRNYRLLSLVLDLMRISDRGRGNVGYSHSTNIAAAVDVDLGGFEEGITTIDLNRSWITRLRDNYNALDDEFRNALIQF